jgi:hypothetical protein
MDGQQNVYGWNRSWASYSRADRHNHNLCGVYGSWLQGAIVATLASFVGLLFYTAIKSSVNVPWDIMRVILGIAALTALLRKIDVLYVVVVASLVSVIAIR